MVIRIPPPQRALALTAAVMLALGACLHASTNDPFPAGYGMSTFNCIIRHDDFSGRQPWLPASLLKDSLTFGFAAHGVYFYDAMDNLRETAIRQISIGGWWQIAKYLTIKAAYARFSALDIYLEDIGQFSAGSQVLKYLNISIELEGFRTGLRDSDVAKHRSLFAGASLSVPLKYLSFTARAGKLLNLSLTDDTYRPPRQLSFGLHTTHGTFGSQGMVLEYTDVEAERIRFFLGEEFWLTPNLGIHFAFATNPLLIGFGFAVNVKSLSSYAGFVHHGELGWSKGFGVDWAQ
ncbi:MAG: hypothetical protein GF398_20835 [Chitinivibrionales bacterium]|nr:hypothetical protein [Chitinivibrionales bacterium]